MTGFGLAFLASGRGSNLQGVLDACRDGRLASVPRVAISNNSGAYALVRARAAGLATHHLSSKTHPSPAALDAAILAALEAAEVELVLLVGYMRKLGAAVLGRFENRILNIHPALLPRHGGRGMYGRHVHEAVLAAGDRVTGVTIHLVDASYDTGPILAQAEVPVESDDDPDRLGARVLTVEHRLLVETLGRIESGEIALPGGLSRTRG